VSADGGIIYVHLPSAREPEYADERGNEVEPGLWYRPDYERGIVRITTAEGVTCELPMRWSWPGAAYDSQARRDAVAADAAAWAAAEAAHRGRSRARDRKAAREERDRKIGTYAVRLARQSDELLDNPKALPAYLLRKWRKEWGSKRLAASTIGRILKEQKVASRVRDL
jgi:hypothetical protein